MLRVADPRWCRAGVLPQLPVHPRARACCSSLCRRVVGVRERASGRLVAAGALLGWIFFTRPYDAAVWGLLGAVPLVVRARAIASAPSCARRAWARRRAAAARGRHAGPEPAAHRQPHRVPDHGRRPARPVRVRRPPPHARASRSSTTGRGWRSRAPGRNAFWLPFFLVGAHLGGVIAAVGRLATTSRRPRSTSCVALGLAFPVAYFAFFGTHISSLTARLSGPIYYIPAYAPLCAPDRHRRWPTSAAAARPSAWPSWPPSSCS